MKILHISDGYPPFSDRLVGRQCRLISDELGKRGHFNRILTSDLTDPAVLDRERAVVRVLKVQSEPVLRSFVRIFGDERRNRRAIRHELNKALPDVAVIWSLAGLSGVAISELQRRRIPVVFAVLDSWPRRRDPEDPWYHWWTAPLPTGPRVLRKMFHCTGLTRAFRARFPLCHPTELRLQRAFFASRALRSSMADTGFVVKDGEIIPCCIGREEFPMAAARRPELRRILWIDPLDSDHDPLTAVQTIQELRHHGAMQFTLDLVGGNGAMEARVHEYLRSAQLTGGVVNVRTPGPRGHAALFPNFDVFLRTARNPAAFPQILLQAMAAQLPVVSTVEGSSADIIRHNENGIAIRAGNPVDAATKIIELADNGDHAARLARQGYDDVVEHYTSAAVARKVETLLASVVGG